MRLHEPKTILFLNRVSLLGGAERVLLRAMRAVADAGNTPLLACPDGGSLPQEARTHGFEVVPFRFNRMRQTTNPARIASYGASLWREGRRVERLCRHRRVDMLHPHGMVAAAYARRAATACGIPMLAHIHDALPLSHAHTALLRYVEAAKPHYVGVSDAACAILRGAGVPDARLHRIYNSLDAAFLCGDHAPSEHVTGRGPHIGVFALIWPLKGQHIFLEAAALLTERFPEARFYLVGSLAYPDYQPYLNDLHRMAERPPLAGKVVFAGYRSDIPRWMAAMDAVALPSVEPEALPTVVMEAMALGVPVVATRHGGTPEILEDGSGGRLIPPGDPSAMADALADLISRAPEAPLRRQVAESVRNRFSQERFADNLGALYATLLYGEEKVAP